MLEMPLHKVKIREYNKLRRFLKIPLIGLRASGKIFSSFFGELFKPLNPNLSR